MSSEFVDTVSAKSCVPDNQLFLTIAVVGRGLYGFASFFMYIINIIALVKLRQCLHGFFQICYTTAAISSCTYFTVHFIFKRFFKLGYFCEFLFSAFQQPNWTIVFAYRIPSTYCPLLILVINALISFHRVTVVVFPMRSKMLWDDYTRHFVLISLLIPFIFMWFVIPCRGHSHILQNGGIGFDYERIETFFGPLSASLFSAIAGTLFGTFTLICTIIIFFTVRACLYFTSYYITDRAVKEFVEWNRIYFIDLFILPQAWTLLLCNKKVRAEVGKMLRIRKKEENLMVTPNDTRKRFDSSF